jgi:hypothetical protein
MTDGQVTTTNRSKTLEASSACSEPPAGLARPPGRSLDGRAARLALAQLLADLDAYLCFDVIDAAGHEAVLQSLRAIWDLIRDDGLTDGSARPPPEPGWLPAAAARPALPPWHAPRAVWSDRARRRGGPLFRRTNMYANPCVIIGQEIVHAWEVRRDPADGCLVVELDDAANGDGYPVPAGTRRVPADTPVEITAEF